MMKEEWAQNKDVIVVVPCKAGSKRVREKNIRNFANSNLVKIKLNQLLKVPEIKLIVVSTDDEEVISICRSFRNPKIKINLEKRDESSRISNLGLVGYIVQMIKEKEGHLLWTHVTSPFFTEKTYSRAIKSYFSNLGEYDSLASVQKIQSFIWDESMNPVNYSIEKGRWPKTQDTNPLYILNSGIFMIPIPLMKKLKDRLGKKVFFFETNDIENIDIDWPENFEIADLLWKNFKRKSTSNFS